MSQIKASNLQFLNDLEANNNREWFATNKARFETERKNIIAFADALLKKMNQHDAIENETGAKCLHRIYRDVRFSKDKRPFKNNWPISFVRASQKNRGGYYLHLQPNASFLGIGFWEPNAADLKRIRIQFSLFGQEFEGILNQKNFKKHFETMTGEKLKNGPKDFDKNDPFLELLKFKQYLLVKSFTDAEVLDAGFLDNVNEAMKAARPFLDFMSEALTTNENGEPLF